MKAAQGLLGRTAEALESEVDWSQSEGNREPVPTPEVLPQSTKDINPRRGVPINGSTNQVQPVSYSNALRSGPGTTTRSSRLKMQPLRK